MHITSDLLKNYIINKFITAIEDYKFDIEKEINSVAVNALSEIYEIVNDNQFTDFEVIEEILFIFQKYGLDLTSRHD